MTITLSDFATLETPVAVTIHSLDLALYQVTLVIDGKEHLLVEDSRQPFKRRSLQAVREVLRLLPVASITLRQQSAYDEMIGQPVREQDNALQVPLSLDNDPKPILH